MTSKGIKGSNKSPDKKNTTAKEHKSRTKIKQEMLALQKIGESLVELPAEMIKKIALPPELREAVLFARTLKKHGPRHRQMQYLGTLMRKIDAEPVKKAVEDLHMSLTGQQHAFHQLERWRDGLIAGNDAMVEEVLNRFPHADRRRLLQIVRSARKEKREEKPPKSFRALFRYLKEL